MAIEAGETILANDGLLPRVMYSENAGPNLGNSFFSDVPAHWSHDAGDATIVYLILLDTKQTQSLDINTIWADADGVRAAVILGAYIYMLMVDTGTAPDTHRVYRFAKNNLAAGGTLMSFAGAVTLATSNDEVMMSCDGTNFYFNYQAGNSGNDYVIAKYTLSGTTLTYSSSITCGAVANTMRTFHVQADGDLMGMSSSDVKYRRYNSSGTLQATSAIVYGSAAQYYLHFICSRLWEGRASGQMVEVVME